jgi:arylsulfatase A
MSHMVHVVKPAHPVITILFAAATIGSTITAAAAERPNIVIILADDLGYGSAGCYGAPGKVLKTPSIDRLAQGGMRFTDANTPSSVCSPTRYGLLTGRYCWRTSLKWGVLDIGSPLHIETSRPTIASMLKQTGYSTGVIGKWHLGLGNKVRSPNDLKSPVLPGPLQVGFDSFFGIPAVHGDAWGVYIDNEGVWGLRSTKHVECAGSCYYHGRKFMGFDAPQRDDWTAQTVLTDRAVDWINRQSKAKPFFLYFATAAVHEPITPTKESQGTSGAGPYGDWIHDVDNSVGRVMQALEETGAAANTLVIFTSDNGGVWVPTKPKNTPKLPAPYSDPGRVPVWAAQEKGLRQNGSFRDGKASIYEGGFRVPFVASWPGHIPAKSESNQMICLVDAIATIAELTGLPLPRPDVGAEDSFSFLPALLGKTDAQPSRDAMVLHSCWGVFAVRKGPWKWIEGIKAEGIPARGNSGKNAKSGEELYDLSKDPEEKQNVIHDHPEVANELRALLKKMRGEGHTRL